MFSVTVVNPLAQPLHFLGLELVILAAFALTLTHALSALRRGDRHPLFQWMVALSYGVTMEIIAFTYLDNYQHGRFTIQLYHDKLPLYVTLLYPTFHYTGLKVIERWRLGLFSEALLAGLAICLLDVPFDIVGVDAKWWSWSTKDRNLLVRWLGVPVTSYYWYLLFGAAYALLCRLLKKRVQSQPLVLSMALAPVIGIAMITLGTIAFQPFHLLQWLGVRDDAMVAAHFAICAGLAVWVRDRRPRGQERIAAIPLLLHGWHAPLLVTLIARGAVADAPAKLASVTAALLGSAWLAWGSSTERRP